MYCSPCLIHELICESVNNGLEAELTTNYAYIRKLVKICDQLLVLCRLSNLSALAGNIEPCSTSCLVLSPPPPTATTDICCFSERKKCNLNQYESHLHSHTVMTRFRDGHERAGSTGHLALMCDVGAIVAHVWQ